jgi:hypothetical protein
MVVWWRHVAVWWCVGMVVWWRHVVVWCMLGSGRVEPSARVRGWRGSMAATGWRWRGGALVRWCVRAVRCGAGGGAVGHMLGYSV